MRLFSGLELKSIPNSDGVHAFVRVGQVGVGHVVEHSGDPVALKDRKA